MRIGDRESRSPCMFCDVSKLLDMCEGNCDYKDMYDDDCNKFSLIKDLNEKIRDYKIRNRINTVGLVIAFVLIVLAMFK